MLENRILTTDNFMRRGGMGPNVYVLYLKEEKIVQHLMVECPFTTEVWESLKAELRLSRPWAHDSIHVCFQSLREKHSQWRGFT